MKKIILIIFVSLMFANIGFAEIREIEKQKMPRGQHYVSTVCVDGYKFVLMRDVDGAGMTQFFEERDGKSLPTKC